MQLNNPSSPNDGNSLSLERRDMAFSLHSKYTVVRRILHISCLVVACYSLAYAVFQFKALSALQTHQYSAVGMSVSRVESANHYARLLATQWSSSAFQDPIEQQTLLDSFIQLSGIVYVSIFDEKGLLIEAKPAEQTVKATLSQIPDVITATASYSAANGKGMVVLMMDDLPFKNLQASRATHLSKGILATLVLGFLGGIYGFRSFRQLRENTRS